jgi:orotidine-5'-phosphate decarboxylase
MLVHLPADHPTAAEAVLFAKAFTDTGIGFAVGPRLFARGGVAAVAAVRAHGPVLADLRLSGDRNSVIGAARVVVAAGADRITLGPGCGPRLVASVADAVSNRGATVVATIVAPEVDEADTATLTGGVGRGRFMSRIAAELAGLGAVEILGRAADVGVVAQVAPALGVVVLGVGDVAAARDARDRGAAAVVLVPGAIPSREAAAPYLTSDG